MTMCKLSWFALGVGLTGLLAACGEESNVDPSTAQAAASELVSAVDTSIAGYEREGGGTGAIVVSCAGGGQASVSGLVDVSTQPVAVDIKVSIDYQGCESASGTTMVGNVDVTQSVVAGEDPVHVKTHYSGDVVFSGKLEAACPVDLTVEVDEAGKSVAVSGTFCGNDAAELDIQLSPHWQMTSR